MSLCLSVRLSKTLGLTHRGQYPFITELVSDSKLHIEYLSPRTGWSSKGSHSESGIHLAIHSRGYNYPSTTLLALATFSIF